MSHYSSLLVLPLAAVAAGCATVGAMRRLPPDAGIAAQYAAPIDTLAAAAETVMVQQRIAVLETSRPDTSTRVIIGSKWSLFGDGEYFRVRVARDTGGLATVWVVSKPFERLARADSRARLRLLQGIDARVASQAIAPVPDARGRTVVVSTGMRVRAIAPDLGWPVLVGELVRITPDTLTVRGEGKDSLVTLPAAGVEQLAVSRGRYGHGAVGVLIGMVVGGLVGQAIGSGTGDPYAPAAGFVAGMGAGGLLGFIVGSSIRTDVWSAVPVGRGGP